VTNPKFMKEKSLRGLTEQLGLEVARAALKMRNDPDKFPDTLDALKVLTTLQSVLARTQAEPEGGGIDEFTRLFGGKDRVVNSSRGDDGGGEADDEPAFDPTETTGLDAGVAGDLDGVGRAAPDASPGAQRHRNGMDRG
jgi:hypothetical protein